MCITVVCECVCVSVCVGVCEYVCVSVGGCLRVLIEGEESKIHI